MKAKKRTTPKRKEQTADTFAPIRRELALACSRINGNPVKRLRWLLKFADLDLDTLSEGRIADLRWEVVVFGLNRKPEEMKDEFDIFLDFHSLTMPLTVDLKRLHSIKSEAELKKYQQEEQAEREKEVPLDLLRQFQTTMRQAFNDLFKPGWWEVTRPTAVERIALDIKSPEGAFHAQNPPSFTGHDVLLMQAIDLIKAERQRLRRCENPRCRNRFVATKKGRPLYCSPRCSAYVRIAKSRGTMEAMKQEYRDHSITWEADLIPDTKFWKGKAHIWFKEGPLQYRNVPLEGPLDRFRTEEQARDYILLAAKKWIDDRLAK